MGSWRDEDVDRFVEQVTPRVAAGQIAIARLTDAYLARVLGVQTVGMVDLAAVRGVDPREVYRRPAVTMRTKLSQGVPFAEALAASVTRAQSLATTDLQLAYTQQSRASLDRDGSHGFRRALSGAENCALCLIASTQRYHKGDLLPIHPGCDCGVEPLDGSEPVGQVIDEDLLEQTHNWVGERHEADVGARDAGFGTGRDYTKLLATREHGEYGPTLTWGRQHFDGAGVVEH